jgi:hypothetical protein
MSFRDQIKQIIRKELIDNGLLPSSSYRLSVVTSLNADGTCSALLDGSAIIATPLYPVTQGQEVMLLIGDRGKISAVPTSVNAPKIDIEHPPFFSGQAALLRFVMDETGGVTGTNDPPTFRFQDEKSSNLYRFIVSDVKNPDTFDGVSAQGYSISPKGRIFAFTANYSGPSTPNGYYTVRAYSIGSKLTSAGPIDLPNLLFTLSPPKLLSSYSTFGNLQPGQNNRIPIDTAITDAGVLYFLELINTGSNFNPPNPLPDYINGPSNILETFNGFGGGGGTLPDFKNSVGLYAASGSSGTFRFHLQSLSGAGFSGAPSWISITSSSGTVYIPGYSSTPVPYDHLLTVDPTGLAVGLYTATITTSAPSVANGTFSIYLAVNTSGQSFTLWKVTSGGAIQSMASLSDPTRKYNDARILNAAKNHIVLLKGPSKTFDIIDITGGNSTPTLSKTITAPSGASLSGGFFSCNTYSSFCNLIQLIGDTPSWFARENLSTGVIDIVTFTNTSSDIGTSSSTTLLETSASAGFMIDQNLVCRKITASGTNATAKALPGIQDISPGQSDPSMWRQLGAVFPRGFAVFGVRS